MSRPVVLALWILGAVLVLMPLTLAKPGLPATLKADEPAYLLSASSLVHDGDLLCTRADLLRLFDEHPYLTPKNLILASDDGWQTLFYGKPYLYSLFAAPFVALAGANGMVAFNMLLLVAMIVMATDYLRRFNGDGIAALFAVGFFLLSNAYAYVFWLHPEVFMMASVTACLYFGLHRARHARVPEGLKGWRSRLAWLGGPQAALGLSAATLALGTYHKPVLAAFALPVLVDQLRQRRWVAGAVWCLAAVVGMGLVAGVSMAFTGHPTTYLVDNRAGFHVDSPDVLPVVPEEQTEVEQEVLEQRAAGWWWIFRIPETPWPELREAMGAFLIGRHTGLLLYQPFAALAVVLFLLHGRRSWPRWSLLAALVMVAFFFLLFIPFNWHGGGGFVGNRYFVVAYPGFLFLVTRIRPLWTPLVGYVVGGLLLGLSLLMPFGAAVPQPTLQSHARALPFQAFPFELGLKEVPGYHGVVLHQVWFSARKDQMRPIDGALWIQGNDRVQVLIQATEPLHDMTFEVWSQAPDNEVSITLGDDHVDLRLEGEPQRIVLQPGPPARVRDEFDLRERDQRQRLYMYEMVVTTATGELPVWRDDHPHHFYLGAALAFRGDRRGL